ncbi:MAG: SpoIVB peptidase [Lachnospiraceae bacterium]
MTGKQKLRRYLVWVFWSAILFTIGFTWYQIEHCIPDRISMVADEESEFHFRFPFDVTLMSDSEEVAIGNQSNIPSQEIHLQLDEPFSLYAKNEGTYKLGLKLFGTIQLKEIEIDVSDTRYAIPCGAPVGIYLKSEGVMVVGTGTITMTDGEEAEPAYGVLQSGDYIEAINGQPLQSKETLISSLNQIGSNEALLRVRRNGESIEVRMNAVQAEDGSYKLGAWVRDDTQGIGTLTYLDANGQFGALGHGISDSDTGKLVEIEQGSLYETEILGIEKGSAGNPGVMAGVIYYGPGSHLGNIQKNTDMGIFGTMDQQAVKAFQGEAIEIGYRQDVQKGKAWLRSGVSGEIKDYEIEIQRVDYNPVHQNKGLVIKVVDEELLALTDGIVQGMSGSPIIQDGKLVGAVTHVFIQDATKGYGIFLESMLNQAEN